jgi:tetratricopeptide (TPR) repeat protein
MTNGNSTIKRPYTQTWLPWVLGIAALGLFLGTLNHSLSFLTDWMTMPYFNQPPAGARVAGWTWQPEFVAPVFYLVTLPIRLLPTHLIPIALNLFSALCATLALVQLARSVALLPHDRTRDQREREMSEEYFLTIPTAWLPPVFAVVALALQLTFWEHGTNGTVEMFDLLLFSYVLRQLLEFRVDEKESRLFLSALVFGAGMANNLAMIGFFPLFVIALVWTRKIAFFNLKFLTRMMLCGLAGLSFYLLLPTIFSAGADGAFTFWELLKSNFQAQNTFLFKIFPRTTILLLSLTSVLPVFLFSIRWSSQFGDPSPLGVMLTTIAFHLSHIVVLLACTWMMVDPSFSPRNVGFKIFAFLPLYYLGALSIGYYSGYLLLVSQAFFGKSTRPSGGAKLFQYGSLVFLVILLGLTATILIHRNLPQIRLTNSTIHKQFAADLAAGIPKNGVIISDDPRRLWTLQDYLAGQHRSKDYTFLCSSWLPAPPYHSYLKRHHPNWVSPKPASAEKKASILDMVLVDLVKALAKTNLITYLHPSFGYYFESFSTKPNGIAQLLSLENEKNLVLPPHNKATIETNQKFWAVASDGILETIRPITEPQDERSKHPFPENYYRKLGLKPEINADATTVGSYYSRSLVYWAVELQKAGDYESAAKHFELAYKLNPENVVAKDNLDFNKRFRAGEIADVQITKSIEDRFGKYRSWDAVLTLNGPYDDPSLTYAQGYVFLQGGLIRQAAQAFDRVRVQSTNDVGSRLWLAQINLNTRFPDRTLELVQEIREIAARTPGLDKNLQDLFTLEAVAYFAKTNFAEGTAIIESNLANFADNFTILAGACKAYADHGRYTNALDITERMLRLVPDDPACLLNKGCFLVELGGYEEAIQSFAQGLTIETNTTSETHIRLMLYRAIANFRADKLDEATKDYEYVQRQYPKLPQISFGLGEIAYRKKDTNAAIRNYENYLANAPTNTTEAKRVIELLGELKGAKPEKPK